MLGYYAYQKRIPYGVQHVSANLLFLSRSVCAAGRRVDGRGPRRDALPSGGVKALGPRPVGLGLVGLAAAPQQSAAA